VKLVLADHLKKAQTLYVGPKGGRWADAAHTVSWHPALALEPSPKVDTDELLEGNLGIKRIDMPQIRSSLVPEFIHELQSKGISVTSESQPAHRLKPTQSELHHEKVQNEVDRQDLEHLQKPVIASKDNYLLDGHHRWAAAHTLDPNMNLNVVRIHLPIKKLLKAAHAFEGVSYKKSDPIQISEMQPAKLYMMNWLGNQTSPKKKVDRSSAIAPAETAGLTAKARKKRRKKDKEAQAEARQRHMAPEERFAGLKHPRPKLKFREFLPQMLPAIREASRSIAKTKRESLALEMERKRAIEPVRDEMRSLVVRR